MKTNELPWGVTLGVAMEEATVFVEKYDGQLEVSYHAGGTNRVKVSCYCGQWEYKGSVSSLADALRSTIREARAVLGQLEKEGRPVRFVPITTTLPPMGTGEGIH